METTAGRSGNPVGQSATPALELTNISKSYPGTKALSEVSFVLGHHRVLGLVGENGAGKSTLLSIVNGTVRPDTGSIAINGDPVRFGHPTEAARHGVATVFQEQGLIPTIPVFENIFLGREQKFIVAGMLRQKAMIEEARQVLDELGVEVSPTALTGSLPFGQRQLVEIAKAFALSRVYPVEPIILLDEPTSALSDNETAKLFDGIQRWRERASFVLVSHRLSDVFATCDEVVALKDGSVVDQRLTSTIDEVGLHELIVGRQRNAEYYREAIQREPSDTVALRANRISKTGHLRDVSLELREGEILGVAGVLGSGKSTLARIVAGAEAQSEGEVVVDNDTLRPGSRRDGIKHGIGFVPAERSVAGIIGTDYGRLEPDAAQSQADRASFPRHDLGAAWPRPDGGMDGAPEGAGAIGVVALPHAVGRQPAEDRLRQMAGRWRPDPCARRSRPGSRCRRQGGYLFADPGSCRTGRGSSAGFRQSA